MFSRSNALLISTALVTLAATAVAVSTPARPNDVAPSVDADYARALELFRAGHHAAAYGRLARLADRGHADAARLALVMTTHSKALFGTAWSATPAQQQRWNALVVNHARGFVPALDTASGD